MIHYKSTKIQFYQILPLQRDQTCFRCPVNGPPETRISNAQAAVQAHAGLRHIPQQRCAQKTAALKQFEMKRLAQTGGDVRNKSTGSWYGFNPKKYPLVN